MIEAIRLTKTYYDSNTQFHALNDVSFSIGDDSITGIIGMSGAGKSTLLRTFSGLVVPDSGSVKIDGLEIGSLDAMAIRRLRRSIGVVFQGYQLLMQKTVYKNIAFPLEIAGMEKTLIKERVDELIRLVGLSGKESQYPAFLSGGQMQRVAIARALSTKPKFILCDEPTSALDSINTKEITTLLAEIRRKEHVTVIIVTHEVGIVRAICDEVFVMDEGRIVESGSVDEVFDHPRADITRLLLGREGS